MNLSFDIVGLIDLVIVFTVLEGAALLLYRAVTGRGLAGADFLVNMVSGLCLMFALRALASGAAPAQVAALLAAAGAAHLGDIVVRSLARRPAAADGVGR